MTTEQTESVMLTPAPEQVWRPIETAPKDGMTIFAANWQTGQRGMVSFNQQGEWEMVNGLNNTPMGVGFYPTHWMHLPEQPSKDSFVLKNDERSEL